MIFVLSGQLSNMISTVSGTEQLTQLCILFRTTSSAWQLVDGLYAAEERCKIPMLAQNFANSFAVNWGPLSETTIFWRTMSAEYVTQCSDGCSTSGNLLYVSMTTLYILPEIGPAESTWMRDQDHDRKIHEWIWTVGGADLMDWQVLHEETIWLVTLVTTSGSKKKHSIFSHLETMSVERKTGHTVYICMCCSVVVLNRLIVWCKHKCLSLKSSCCMSRNWMLWSKKSHKGRWSVETVKELSYANTDGSVSFRKWCWVSPSLTGNNFVGLVSVCKWRMHLMRQNGSSTMEWSTTWQKEFVG